MQKLTDEELKQLHNTHLQNAIMVQGELLRRGYKLYNRRESSGHWHLVKDQPNIDFHFARSCGHSEPESTWSDPDTGAHRTAHCEFGRLVSRGNGLDSFTDGTIFMTSRWCPVCFKDKIAS